MTYRKDNIENRLRHETGAKDQREAAWLVVKEILSQHFLSMAKLEPTTSFDSLGADSLDNVELLMCVEDEFGIEVSDDEAAKWGCGNDIIDYLLKDEHEA